MGLEDFIGQWQVEATEAGEVAGDLVQIAVSVVCTTNGGHNPYGPGTYQPDPEDPEAPWVVCGFGNPPSYTIRYTPATDTAPARITTWVEDNRVTGSWTANDTSGPG